jgi:myosin-5
MGLKAEARSVLKFQEISYRLENKVVELTQTLQARTEEKKALQAQLYELERQIQQWSSKHEEADAKAKSLQTALSTAEAELSRREELLQAKADVEKRLEEAVAKAMEKETSIQKLSGELIAQAEKLQSQEKTFANAPSRSVEDGSVILTLKNEVSSLREQLNRANAYNSLTRNARVEAPVSPTFAPALRMPGLSNGPSLAPSSGSHQRRHSSAGVVQLSPADIRTSVDELMLDVKKNQALNHRAVSVAYNGEDNARIRSNDLGYGRLYDDVAEEKIKLMQDTKRLDEDVLGGLIRGLKIPAPSLTNPSAVKEILFPANLISLVTNEMWKYGLIPESERFLANVMQSIQAHVMVMSFFHWVFPFANTLFSSHSTVKIPLFPGSTGFRMSMRCCHLSMLPRATWNKVSALEKRMLSENSTGMITNGWSRSSSTILAVWSITYTTRGC